MECEQYVSDKGLETPGLESSSVSDAYLFGWSLQWVLVRKRSLVFVGWLSPWQQEQREW